MQGQHEVVRVLSDYQDLWQSSFPGLTRRAQWHMVRYLCASARQGCSVGEISGFVRQIFLLDDATVRERIVGFEQQGLCTLDARPGSPSARGITARSFIAPTPRLLAQFDQHLAALADRLAQAVATMEGRALSRAPPAPEADRRETMLRAIDAYCAPWGAALDHVLAANKLSQARRFEARRHLLSPSHWALAHMAVQHHYQQGAAEGVLADRMAAELIQRIGQNFQTTRDHIAYLLEIGLLERRPGKSLHVALAPSAAAALHQALGETAAQWRRLLGTAASPPTADATISLRPGAAVAAGHLLRIVDPPAARRHVPIAAIPLTIGRGASAGLILDGAEISRAHCRIELLDGQICVTDLGSTNGTFVDGRKISGPAALRRGSVLTIGAYLLEYEHHLPPEDGGTLSLPPRDMRESLRNKAGNSP